MGPITLRSSKSQRVTFIECPNDINSMIDLAKVADLALLLVDASIGFEMETFEFLSIMKVNKYFILGDFKFFFSESWVSECHGNNDSFRFL